MNSTAGRVRGVSVSSLASCVMTPNTRRRPQGRKADGPGATAPGPRHAFSFQSATVMTTAASDGSKLASRSANFAAACSGIFSSFTFTTLVDEPRCTV